MTVQNEPADRWIDGHDGTTMRSLSAYMQICENIKTGSESSFSFSLKKKTDSINLTGKIISSDFYQYNSNSVFSQFKENWYLCGDLNVNESIIILTPLSPSPPQVYRFPLQLSATQCIHQWPNINIFVKMMLHLSKLLWCEILRGTSDIFRQPFTTQKIGKNGLALRKIWRLQDVRGDQSMVFHHKS